MEHVKDHAGSKGARGMALMGCDIKDLARLQDVGDTRDCKLEGAAQQQGPLLLRVRVTGDDGARCDVYSALGYMARVDIAAEVARSDLTWCNGGEVE